MPFADASNQNTSFKEKIVILLSACIPFFVWLISTGNITAYFTLQVPPGQVYYIFSKLAGLYAYFFLALQLIVGFLGRGSHYFYLHPYIGIFLTFTVLLHASLFMAGGLLRTKHIPLDILLPQFASGYYKNSIGYGVIAGYLLLLIIAAGVLQKRFQIFKIIHRAAPAIALLGWLHSFNIGTETRSLPIMSFYVFFFFLAIIVYIRKLALRNYFGKTT